MTPQPRRLLVEIPAVAGADYAVGAPTHIVTVRIDPGELLYIAACINLAEAHHSGEIAVGAQCLENIRTIAQHFGLAPDRRHRIGHALARALDAVFGRRVRA